MNINLIVSAAKKKYIYFSYSLSFLLSVDARCKLISCGIRFRILRVYTRSILISSFCAALSFAYICAYLCGISYTRNIARAQQFFFFFFFSFTRNKDGRASPFAVSCSLPPVLCSNNEAKCRRAYRDALCRMYFYQRKCVVVRARIPDRGCLEKAMLERRARDAHLLSSPPSRRVADPESLGESITRKSIASRW